MIASEKNIPSGTDLNKLYSHTECRVSVTLQEGVCGKCQNLSAIPVVAPIPEVTPIVSPKQSWADQMEALQQDQPKTALKLDTNVALLFKKDPRFGGEGICYLQAPLDFELESNFGIKFGGNIYMPSGTVPTKKDDPMAPYSITLPIGTEVLTDSGFTSKIGPTGLVVAVPSDCSVIVPAGTRLSQADFPISFPPLEADCKGTLMCLNYFIEEAERKNLVVPDKGEKGEKGEKEEKGEKMENAKKIPEPPKIPSVPQDKTYSQ